LNGEGIRATISTEEMSQLQLFHVSKEDILQAPVVYILPKVRVYSGLIELNPHDTNLFGLFVTFQ
jgi:hypothetical protein